MLTFYGLAALTIAEGTNRSPETLSEDGMSWVETPAVKLKSLAIREPHKVRVRGYRGVLLKKATPEARALIEALS